MRDMRDEEIYLVDTPGLKDTGGIEIELANSYGVVKALEQCREITIVLVVSIESWGTKGTGFKLLAQSVSSVIQNINRNKRSIIYCFNRFGSDLIPKLVELIGGLTELERSNSNFMFLMKDLEAKATSNEIMIFDILDRAECKRKLREMIKLQSIAKEDNAFKCIQPSSKDISRFHQDYKTAIDYYFKCENPAMVKYFLKQYRGLAELLNEAPNIQQYVQEVEDDIIRKLEDEFNEKTRHITSMKHNTLQRLDLEELYTSLHKLERKASYQDVLDVLKLDCSWMRRGLDITLKIAEDLAKEIEGSLTEPHIFEDQVIQKLENLYLLKECESPDRSHNASIKEMLKRLSDKIVELSEVTKNQYIEKLNEE